MTGFDKIIHKIQRESENTCDAILLSAQKERDEILRRAAERADELIKEAETQAAKKAAGIENTAKSVAAQQEKQWLLASRVGVVTDALCAAEKALGEMPAAEYFDSLQTLAVKNARKGQALMGLSAEDLERLPAGFEEALNEKLSAAGACVTLNDTPAKISKGFILAYGDIEINCSFEALFEARREELKELVCAILF